MDPIVKSGAQRLTADDVVAWLEAHPEACVPAPRLAGKVGLLEVICVKAAQHHGNGTVFEARDEPGRTDVRGRP